MGRAPPACEPSPRHTVDFPFHEPISTITPSPRHERASSYSASPSSSVSQPGMSAISGLTRVSKSVVVLVMAAPPHSRLVAAERSTVAPLVHAPQPVEPARVRGVRVIHDPVLAREGAHSRSLAQKRRDVGPDRLRKDRNGAVGIEARPLVDLVEVVFDGTSALLLLRERDAEVVVEVVTRRGRPRERPAHRLPERVDV